VAAWEMSPTGTLKQTNNELRRLAKALVRVTSAKWQNSLTFRQFQD
jgi:hypothetical protein